MAAPSSSARNARAGNGLYAPVHPVRFVTAAALFDGHDAAINIMRRVLVCFPEGILLKHCDRVRFRIGIEPNLVVAYHGAKIGQPVG